MRIIHRNAIDDYTLTATLAESGYPVSNLQDLTLAKKWRSPAFNNLIDRPDCESTTPPMIFDETVPYIPGGPDATFARDAIHHTGTYGYRITKTVASGTGTYVMLCDNNNTNDMHGLIAGYTYTKSVWVKIPAGSGIALDEVYFQIRDYYDGAWDVSQSSIPTAFDIWQKISATKTIRQTAVAANIRFNLPYTIEDTEYYYVDDIRLDDVPQIKIDAGSNNVISTKSFAIGGHNLTGGAKITIEGNDSADFDSPSYSDELTRNLIVDPEDLTTSNWNNAYCTDSLTNLYVKGRRLTKIITNADENANIRQLQYPNNTTQSFQAILRKGNSTDSYIKYTRNTSPWNTYGTIVVTWATKTVTSTDGLTNLDYEWIDDETVWIVGTANAIDTSLVCRLELYICPTDRLTGKYVYATAMMVEDNPTVTKYEEIHADLRIHIFSEASYRYWQILIEDFDNPDGYVEAGRISIEGFLQMPGIEPGLTYPKKTTSTKDITVTGQVYGDKGIIARMPGFAFPLIEDNLRKLIDAMFDEVHNIKPIFLIVYENSLDVIPALYCTIDQEELPWKKAEDGLNWSVEIKFLEAF